MARIAIAGMQHETNTFAPSPADYEAFAVGGEWPGIQRGEALFEAVAGANLPAQGAIAALRNAGHSLVPLTWAAASPSDKVTDDAFERIVGAICDDLMAAGTVDGVYLDLHGAMVTESHDDGEGETLRRVRACVGPRVPVSASLDLHANVTQEMVDISDALTIYRTYPHIDMAETGGRAAAMLMRLLSTQEAFKKSFHQFDYLTGLPSQCTSLEPARTLYRQMEAHEQKHGVQMSFAMGFPMADFADCGMTALMYREPHRGSDAVFRDLVEAIEAAESDFSMTLYSPDEAVRFGMERGEPGAPVIIADTQDNPGAGGNGDTTGMLEAMLRHGARDGAVGLLIDPASAAQAHEVGQGGSAEFELGAVSGLPGHQPVGGRFEVERLGDGDFMCTGPMYAGIHAKLGPMALLRSGGVKVVLASRQAQAADLEMFRHVGLDPITCRFVVVKSSVHFRAAFEPIAREVIVGVAPGPSLADPADFPWRRLRRGVRLNPKGPEFGL